MRISTLLTFLCIISADAWAQQDAADTSAIAQNTDETNVANDLRGKLLGAWSLDLTRPNPNGYTFRKFWGERDWAITTYGPNGEIISHHGGTYTLDGNKYTESIEFAAELTKDWIGRQLQFTIEVDGDKYTQKGIDNNFNETWERLRHKDSTSELNATTSDAD